MILKALRGLAQPIEIENVDLAGTEVQVGVNESVCSKVFELVMAWPPGHT